jgi:putative oxidoreductase
MTNDEAGGGAGENPLLALIRAILDWLEKMPHAVLALLARLGLAAVFWGAGMDKMTNWRIKSETFEAFAHEYNIPLLPPELATHLATFVEHLTPILMLLGLATRAAGGAMLGVIAVIFIFVHQDEWPALLLWSGAIAFLLTKGPGVLSLDHLIRSWLLPKR